MTADSAEGRVEGLVERWRADHDGDPRAGLFPDFLRAFLARGAARAFRTHDEAALLAAAEAAFELAAERRPGDRRVRVRLPEELPGRAVIEILQDDRPFLVDTIRLLLRREELREQLFLHPTLSIQRDAEGRLEAVASAEEGTPSGRLQESFLFVEVYPRIDALTSGAFERKIDDVMSAVADVTDDHTRMIRAVREISANVEFAGRRLDVAAGRSDKICRFLDWLIEDHFVFMGVRHYDVRRDAGGWAVSIRPEGGLGIWRDATASRFVEPVAGDQLPPGLRGSLDDPRIIQVSKGWVESRIHRAGRLDRILVKEHDEQGQFVGFCIVSGLFTFSALRAPSSTVPLLAERLEQILEAEKATRGSHRYKALVAAFDSAPMEFLLGAQVEDNSTLIHEIVEAEGFDEPRVVLRSDAGGRSFYAAVIMPRARYGEALRASIRRLFERDHAVGYVDDRVSFLEEGNALLHFFCTMTTGDVPVVERLQAEITALASRWADRLTEELIRHYGPAHGGELAALYVDAFPEGLHVSTHPADGLRDVIGLEALHETGEPQVALLVDRARPDDPDQMLRLYLGEEKLLSDLLPLIDQLGIRVIDARQVRVHALGRPLAYLHVLRVERLGDDQADLDALEARVGDALRAVLSEDMPSDPLNALVLVAGLDWRQVDLLRAYLEYFNQIQTSLTRRFVVDVLVQNPLAARLLVRLHAARLGPGPEDAARAEQEDLLRGELAAYRDRIDSLNEDRAIGTLHELIEATLRTNFYAELEGAHRIALKLDPSRVSAVHPPHAWREIFVHGAGLDGIHLRGGPVARGGLRWSDRLDDYRTEILGLMRTQQLKNGLIVPVGAKGGFVLRRTGLTPAEARAEADDRYRVFIAALLDVTDDISPDGAVLPPRDVHRRDGDDPYLVVAADKGTAHLSDTANAVAQARGFWLGDAFASGGSVGYDHKKYAITARGAWECVRHHFGELGIDPERDAYSVVGIGDMSGDVFGNGLLLMRQARLVAAFDHRHVFLDPDPDPEVAWQERKRLFDTPRSTWNDYDRDRLSAGGGIHPRSAKRIELSPQVRERLGIEAETLTGPELVRAILAAPVDLLWNGGIGTYVKATDESHADVGDRANESVRIDATALRARVIGEGGNLGLTQAARVEAALAGVRLDTDAIHNSAGVDLSDHEVNFKILLTPTVRAGRLSEDARRALLHEAAETACEAALAHNRGQALSISLDELRARADLESFRVAMDALCEAQGVTRAELGLPDDETLAGRRGRDEALTRPELAVLLGLAKLDLRLSLGEADEPPGAAASEGPHLVDAPALAPLREAYFPESLRAVEGVEVEQHRLARELTALQIANRIIDTGGVTAVAGLVSGRGLPPATAAAAWWSADAILRGPALREGLLALRGRVGLSDVYASLLELDAAIQSVARYLVSEDLGLVEEGRVRAWAEALERSAAEPQRFLSPAFAEEHAARIDTLRTRGLPDPVPPVLASAPFADRALDVIRLEEETASDHDGLLRAYARLGERSGIDRVFLGLSEANAESVWDRILLTDMRTELLALQRELVRAAVERAPGDPVAAVDAFLAARRSIIERAAGLVPERPADVSASALVVATQTLLRLRSELRA